MEQTELQRLQSDSSVTVRPADKGSQWVIMPTERYVAEAQRQLSDRLRYTPIDNDLDRTVKLRLQRLLAHLHQTRFLSQREMRGLSPRDHYRSRSFFLLPKVHKEIWPDPETPPGRPIVSDKKSVSRPCASLLEFFLTPIAERAPSFLRDSHHLIALLHDLRLNSNSILFTMDVAALYSNIPIEGGLEAVSEAFRLHPDPRRPDLTLLTMLRLLLTHNTFTFEGQQFLQCTGTAMGAAYSGAFANIYMARWETRTLAHHLQPRIWLRFIDDIFGLWDHGLDALHEFHNFLNGIDNNIQLDMHFDSNSVRFLDLEIYRTADDHLGYRIGFKATDSHMILPSSSHHPRPVFSGILYSQILRWASRSYSHEDFLQTKALVTPSWRRQGYSRSAIRSAMKKVFSITSQTPTSWTTGFFPCATCHVCRQGIRTSSFKDDLSRHAYHISHRMTCSDSNLIYCISCALCHHRYIGQTSRPLRNRIKEHLADIKASRPTAVSLHFSSCGAEHFRFFAIERVPNQEKRLLKEARWIERLHTASPRGININSSGPRRKPVLVLPHSRCANNIMSLCRSLTSPLTDITCAKRRATNLREALQ